MKIKKDIYMNEEGLCKESADGMPKGWRKGKLVARGEKNKHDKNRTPITKEVIPVLPPALTPAPDST